MPGMTASIAGAPAGVLEECSAVVAGAAGAGAGGRAGLGYVPGGWWGAAQAMGSTASQGAAATAVGGDQGGAVTGGEAVGGVVEADELGGAFGGQAGLGPEPRPQPLAAPSGLGGQPLDADLSPAGHHLLPGEGGRRRQPYLQALDVPAARPDGSGRTDHHSGTFLQDTRRRRRLASCACPQVPHLASSPHRPAAGNRRPIMTSALSCAPVAAAVFGVPQFLPQVLKLRATHDAAGISWSWAVLTSVSNAAWIAYFALFRYWTALIPACSVTLLAGTAAQVDSRPLHLCPIRGGVPRPGRQTRLARRSCDDLHRIGHPRSPRPRGR